MSDLEPEPLRTDLEGDHQVDLVAHKRDQVVPQVSREADLGVLWEVDGTEDGGQPLVQEDEDNRKWWPQTDPRSL